MWNRTWGALALVAVLSGTGLAQTWTSGTNMPTARYFLAAAAADGAVYAIGGGQANYSGMTTVERYDVANDTWTSVASLPSGRMELDAAALGDTIYAVGGLGGSSSSPSLFKYDVVSGTWSTGTSMQTPRAGLGVVAFNGLIYAIGGYTNDSESLAAVEIYDPATGAWSSGTPLPLPLQGFSVATDGNQIYVAGGLNIGDFFVSDSLYVFEPLASDGTGVWSRGANLPGGPGQDAEGAFAKGQFFVIAGLENWGPRTDSVYAYTPGTDSWASAPALGVPVAQFGATVINDQLVAVGGLTDSGVSSAINIIDPPGTSSGGGDTDELLLPEVAGIPAGGAFTVTISGTVTGARNLDLAFVFDSQVIVPQVDALISTAFDNAADVETDWNVFGDTLVVAMAASEPVSVVNGPIAELSFTAVGAGTSDLAWIGTITNANEVTPSLVDGAVTVSSIRYGDVTADGSVTAYDASQILQYVVHKIEGIPLTEADVSDDGSVTSFDAALILYKVVMPSYLFPTEGGSAPAKVSRADAVTLAWQRTDGAWLLTSNVAAGPIGADLTLRMPVDATLSADGIMESRRDGEIVTVSIASPSASGVLLRIEGANSAPEILSGSVNERSASLAASRPVALTLSQNSPNPFNPNTTISFTLPESGKLTLRIYSMNGQLVRSLVDSELPAGTHEAVWDGLDTSGRPAASGVYTYRLTSTNGTASHRMTLVR